MSLDVQLQERWNLYWQVNLLDCTYGCNLWNHYNLQYLPSKISLQPRNPHISRDCQSQGFQRPKEETGRDAENGSKGSITSDVQCHRINWPVCLQVTQENQLMF